MTHPSALLDPFARARAIRACGRLLSAALLCGFLAATSSCGTSDTEAALPPGGPDDTKLVIAATTGMVADLARNIAGDRATVVSLIDPGVDPHLYKPTRSDIGRIMDADLVLYNGLLLEGQMVDAFARAAEAGKPVVAVAESLDPAVLLSPDAFEDQNDPHVWMDPAAWVETIGVVQAALADADPAGAEVFEQNAASYTGEILVIDAYAERVLATVPEERRVLVTAHDAFNYFGERFGFEVVGIQGISTESEAGVRDIERIVSLLVDRAIPAVFIESTVTDRNVEALLAGARARGVDAVIGGELYSDAMGPSGTYTGTYLGMIDHNVTTITRALGGEAPAGGAAGRLADRAEQSAAPADEPAG
ncbi:MAG: zinc ABC transporter substrate-binding protein [Planctomycetota bacterium]